VDLEKKTTVLVRFWDIALLLRGRNGRGEVFMQPVQKSVLRALLFLVISERLTDSQVNLSHIENVPLRFRHVPSALADPKYVPVRVPHVHLADVPRHVGRCESDVQTGGDTLSVDRVHIVYPHRHPDALVSRLVSTWSKRGGVRPLAAAPLASLAKKDFAFA
jgi:hypothetical protein